jgi:hypothetical protein
MAIYDFFLSRNGAVSTPENYVGHTGRLFYDSATGVIKLSDGTTPGGLSIPYTIASDTVVGGVKAGPGVTINSEGQILIDSEGLSFSFGDFSGTVGTYTDETEYALLSSINADEDVVVASNGTGSIKVVGQFDIYKTNGSVTASLEDYEPFFRVKDDGQVRMLVPAEDPIEGAVEIVGSASGNYIPPGQAGAMLQITGNPELPARIYLDGNAEYASFVARRFNGTVAAPTAVLANQDVFRLNATAATSSGMGGVALGQIRITALENQTATAQGSKIVFTVTPVGVAATSRVDVATITTADGVSATKFTGPLTGNVTGNVTGTSGHFTNINANVAAANAAIITANTAMKSYVDAVTTAWTANAATQQVQIDSLATGANANVAAYLTTATGNITADNISDSVGSLRSIPQNSKNTGYTLQSTDNGQMINITTGNVTVPAGVFNSPFGQTVSIYNNQTTSNAVVQGSGVTLRLAGTLSTGNRTLARYGVATMICVAANTFVISGAGLS